MAYGEDRSMAQTEQAWDWGVELRDEERSELELLRSSVAELRTQLDQAQEALRAADSAIRTQGRHSGSSPKPGPGAAAASGRRCENVSCSRSQRTPDVVRSGLAPAGCPQLRPVARSRSSCQRSAGNEFRVTRASA